jgi:hypothetical protein
VRRWRIIQAAERARQAIELDDLAQEAAPLAGSQAVGVDDGGELTGPVREGWQVLEPGNEVVMELGVEPGQLGQFHQRVDRSGGLPVDKGDRQAVPGDDVPGGYITMAGNLDRVA